jgi:hypothetical protein
MSELVLELEEFAKTGRSLISLKEGWTCPLQPAGSWPMCQRPWLPLSVREYESARCLDLLGPAFRAKD